MSCPNPSNLIQTANFCIYFYILSRTLGGFIEHFLAQYPERQNVPVNYHLPPSNKVLSAPLSYQIFTSQPTQVAST